MSIPTLGRRGVVVVIGGGFRVGEKICNQGVGGSSPSAGTKIFLLNQVLSCLRPVLPSGLGTPLAQSRAKLVNVEPHRVSQRGWV